jgi:EAL domain-containing protein (putative c-di-GMP-specific phosphodiesterase class I)
VHGTGRFVHFTADHRFHDAAGRARNPVSTRSALRRALDRDELELHYQPIIRLGESPADCPVGPVSADRVAGYEALLRWRDPTRGLLDE